MLKHPCHIVCVGVSFRTAPLELRERLSHSVAPKSLREYSDNERSDDSLAILSTCNRVEIYAGTRDGEHAKTRLKDYLTYLADDVRGRLYSFSDGEAIRHLFNVACGMDSMVLGEPQILLQVKHVEQIKNNGTGEVIERLFHQAYSAARRIRGDAGIESNASISSAALKLIRSKLSFKPSLLIVGGGKMATNALRNMTWGEFGQISIANRTPDKLNTSSLDGVQVYPLQKIPLLLSKVDAAIIATAAPEYIVKSETLKARKNGKKLLLVDISIPRNVDPSLARLPGVELCNIDDLVPYAETQLDREQLRKAEELIGEETERFASWLSALEINPLVRSIRTKAEEIRGEEVAVAVKKLSGVKELDAGVLADLSSNIVNRLLHVPTVRLREHAKEGDAAEYDRLIRDLFGIDD